MSILHYFKQKDGFPDPKRSLCDSIPFAAIVSVNREVQKTLASAMKKNRAHTQSR